MSQSKLRVAVAQVKNVLGIGEASIEPGKVTIITGKNGTNKSSLIAAIQAALGGGNLVKLQKVGTEDPPEVVLELRGPGHEAYRVERKADKVRIRERVGDTAAFEDMGKPQTWLKGLFDPAGCNPVKFLTAADKDLAILILEALPLALDEPGLMAILGDLVEHVPAIPRGLHPLEHVAMVREAIFKARTGVNRDLDGKNKAADQVRRNAPAVIPENPKEELAELQQEIEEAAALIATATSDANAAEKKVVAEAQAVHDLTEEKIRASHRAAVEKLETDHAKAAAAERASLEAEIARLKAQTEERIRGWREEVNVAVVGLKEADGAAIETIDATLESARKAARETRDLAQAEISAATEEVAKKRIRLATLTEQVGEASRAAGLHEQAKTFEDEAAALDAVSKRMTGALDEIDAFRRKMADNLPIPGLSIEGSVVRVNDIPFDQLNTAQRVKIAVKLSVLRATGRLPIIFVDGAEALDQEHFNLLVEELKDSGVQAFVTRVEDHDPKVEARA